MTRDEFERRYEALPDIKKAELIEGVVYVASPVRFDQHAEQHADLFDAVEWNAMFTRRINFNLPAATCGKVCVVEVEEIVPTGSLEPDCIHLPGVYVQRMIIGAPYDKKIEFRTVRERETA